MKKNLSYIIMLVAGAIIMAACSKDELPNDIPDAAGSEILFTGAIKKQSEVLATTRANDIPDPDDYIILNGTNREFGTFYIWMDVEEMSSYFQQYEIVSGEQGSLGVIDNGDKLNWKDKTSNHTFYAWTQPHVTGNEDETSTITGGVNMQIPEFGTKENSSEKPSGTVTFGTNGETNLEQFIITKKGPISYNTWGQDVALYFERPISKIVLDMVIHIDANGVISKNIEECSIVFPNMYKEAAFNPFSFGDVNKSLLKGDDENGKGIEWNWKKNNNKSNSLYVLPFKFGDDDNSIQNDFGYFIVTLDDKNYAGSLNSLIIDESDTPNELKAGECLKLYLTINDGGGVGIGYQIIDWNTEGNEDIYEHRIPGVYNKEDADRLLEALTTTDESKKFPIGVEDLIVNTGDDTNPSYEINIFTHINWSLVTTEIKIPDNYTLKGNGFNVTLGQGGRISGEVENIYIDGKKPEESTTTPES